AAASEEGPEGGDPSGLPHNRMLYHLFQSASPKPTLLGPLRSLNRKRSGRQPRVPTDHHHRTTGTPVETVPRIAMFRAQLALVAVFAIPVAFVAAIYQDQGGKGNPDLDWLGVARAALTGNALLPLVFQFYLLFGVQLFCLYGLYVQRKAEVFI